MSLFLEPAPKKFEGFLIVEEMDPQILLEVGIDPQEVIDVFRSPDVDILTEETADDKEANGLAFKWIGRITNMAEKHNAAKKASVMWAMFGAGVGTLGYIIAIASKNSGGIQGGIITMVVGSLVALIGGVVKSSDYQEEARKISVEASILMPKIRRLKAKVKDPVALQNLEELERKLREQILEREEYMTQTNGAQAGSSIRVNP